MTNLHEASLALVNELAPYCSILTRVGRCDHHLGETIDHGCRPCAVVAVEGLALAIAFEVERRLRVAPPGPRP